MQLLGQALEPTANRADQFIARDVDELERQFCEEPLELELVLERCALRLRRGLGGTRQAIVPQVLTSLS